MHISTQVQEGECPRLSRKRGGGGVGHRLTGSAILVEGRWVVEVLRRASRKQLSIQMGKGCSSAEHLFGM